MEVALTRTDGVAGSEGTPLLLFWKETDFSTGTLGSPYKTSTPAGGIGDYADAPYNTETDYPADNSRVVVMGLCPSAMTTRTVIYLFVAFESRADRCTGDSEWGYG